MLNFVTDFLNLRPSLITYITGLKLKTAFFIDHYILLRNNSTDNQN